MKKKKKIGFLRQGDVGAYVNLDPETKGEQVKDSIVARGETSGHLHRIDGGTLFAENEGSMTIEAKNTATLRHTYENSTHVAEHEELVIPKGKTHVEIQRRYNPFTRKAELTKD